MFEKLRPILPVLLLTLAACGGGREEPAQPTEAPAAPEQVVPIAPITSRDSASSDAGIDFTLPSGWTSETPSSNMRLAQASIPGPGGPGQLAVFNFGAGVGGDVDSNIQRWVGQVDPDPGAQPARETFDTKDGLRVTWVEVAGTLKASPMGGPASPQPNSRLLGAVVEGPGGPWFFKATGPKATLDPERDHFLEMLRSVQKK